jgi:hypothetical protein
VQNISIQGRVHAWGLGRILILVKDWVDLQQGTRTSTSPAEKYKDWKADDDTSKQFSFHVGCSLIAF